MKFSELLQNSALTTMKARKKTYHAFSQTRANAPISTLAGYKHSSPLLTIDKFDDAG